MPVRGFLISWAMPAASTPTLINRSERRICSSMCFLAVMSLQKKQINDMALIVLADF